MIKTLFARVVETYRAPRPSVRRVIDDVRGPTDVAMIFALSFCLNAGVVILVSLLVGGDAATGAIAFTATNLIFSAVAFAAVTLLIWRIGKVFGGRGAPQDIAAAIAWHSLATAIFAPLLAASTVVDPESASAGLLGLAQLVMVGVVLWLLANFVAEAHGFSSAWKVAGGLFVGMLALAFLLSIVLSGFISRP